MRIHQQLLCWKPAAAVRLTASYSSLSSDLCAWAAEKRMMYRN
ncbi:hypothetical protein OESDEN_19381 [Oesophagostomum dentatum]|uniref:Uncharacterized protein n=1 Tax=Oesophagostomum dentatum TaxID=61180 RepID=A0A0B1S6G6_OESDE|nr:hypothetical protein OESDEN_19381 [Oesophagostomum dentatum]